MLGGLSWFAVPWAFASCLGLAARALQNNVRARSRPMTFSSRHLAVSSQSSRPTRTHYQRNSLAQA